AQPGRDGWSDAFWILQISAHAAKLEAQDERRVNVGESHPFHLPFISGSQNSDMRVLVVEDELRMASLIRRGLVKEGLAADIAPNGEEALVSARASDYDAIVLDVMLPGINGFETCRRLRKDGVWAPVLMLTARDSVEDRVAGLDTGADDYLVKPFAFVELL